MTIPAKTRLDNAGLIYPSCKTTKHAISFRISVTLKDSIDPDMLQTALETMMNRFPTFNYTIAKDFFWWYLKRMDKTPKVCPSRPMGLFDYEKNDGFLFRVGYQGARIDLDVFHALTDGTGATIFLMSLVAHYTHQRYGTALSEGRWLLSPDMEPNMEEFEDSFDHFSGRKGSLDKGDKAFHIKGRDLPARELACNRICVPSVDLKEAASTYGCTVTEFVTSVLIYSLQELRGGNRKSSPFLKVEVPINLRPIFGRRTLRNFSSYMHIGVDVRNGDMPFEEIVHNVSLQKKMYVQPRQLTTRIAANVELEENRFIAAIPRFIKKPIMQLIYFLKSDKYCSTTFSNLGEVSLPEEISQHIKDIEFIQGRPVRRAELCSCVSFGGQCVINLSRKIRDDYFDKIFERNLFSFVSSAIA